MLPLHALVTAVLIPGGLQLVEPPSAPPAGDSWDETDEVPAEGPSDEAPVADGEVPAGPTPQGEPVAAPVAPAAVAAAPAAPPPTRESIIMPKSGLGLIITSGVLGGVAWGVMGLRIGRIKKLCVADDIDVDTVSEDTLGDVTESLSDCFVSGRGGNLGLWFLQAIPNSVNWGMAPAAGRQRAKFDAVRFVKSGEADRKPVVFIATGASLLAAGAIGRVVVAATRIRSINPNEGIAVNCIRETETDVSEFFDCYGNTNALLYFGHQLTSGAIAGGAGLLTYGLVYKKERRRLEKMLEPKPALEVTVAPEVSFNYTGVNATLRF